MIIPIIRPSLIVCGLPLAMAGCSGHSEGPTRSEGAPSDPDGSGAMPIEAATEDQTPGAGSSMGATGSPLERDTDAEPAGVVEAEPNAGAQAGADGHDGSQGGEDTQAGADSQLEPEPAQVEEIEPLAADVEPEAAGAPSAVDMDPASAGVGPDDGAATPTSGSSAASGTEDGDSGGAVVSIPGVACGENPSLLGLTTQNLEVGGRGVHLAYPCDKHAGAPMLFVLNLHGTMPSEELKGYQVAYFSINNYVNSHNLITAAPKSVVSQWGNSDGGVDKPHIMDVIDYVYTNFAEFDIRGMWIAGHSWGAMYSTSLVCDPALSDKVVGAVLQSGSGEAPACADRISVISSAAEDDIGPVISQGATPTLHGCGASQEGMVGNNVETFWPDCDPGFTHANYFMLGKAHADYMDDVVVERIADLMKASRP